MDYPQEHQSLRELARELAIYLIPECDTEEDVHEILRELCEEILHAGVYSKERYYDVVIGGIPE